MNFQRTPPLVPGDRKVPWLHVLPASWKVVPLKAVATLNVKKLSEDTRPDREMRYVDIGSVNRIGRITETTDYVFEKAPSRARRLVQDGDTIVSTVRTYLQAIAFISAPDDDMVCSTGFAVITPHNMLVPKFMYYWLRTSLMIDEICARSVGVSYPAINGGEIMDLPIPLPSKDLQSRMIRRIEARLPAIDELLSLVPMEELYALREGLITVAMTGRDETATNGGAGDE